MSIVCLHFFSTVFSFNKRLRLKPGVKKKNMLCFDVKCHERLKRLPHIENHLTSKEVKCHDHQGLLSCQLQAAQTHISSDIQQFNSNLFFNGLRARRSCKQCIYRICNRCNINSDIQQLHMLIFLLCFQQRACNCTNIRRAKSGNCSVKIISLCLHHLENGKIKKHT